MCLLSNILNCSTANKLFFYWDIICFWCCDDRFIFFLFFLVAFEQCSTFVRSRSNWVGLKISEACKTIKRRTFVDLWAGIIRSIILPFSVFYRSSHIKTFLLFSNAGLVIRARWIKSALLVICIVFGEDPKYFRN